MSVASEVSRISYSGNGSTAEFPVPFNFLREQDLVVVRREAGGKEDILTLTTDYTISNPDDSVGGACTLTDPPGEGETLVIKRDPPVVQETVYTENVPLSARARENALDLLTMIAQANRERLDRAVTLRVTSSTTDVTLPEPESGRLLGWNEEGNNLQNRDAALLGAVSLPVSVEQGGTGATTQGQGLANLGVSDFARGVLEKTSGQEMLAALGVSDFGRALLDDVDAAAARTTLEAGTGGASENLIIAEAMRRAIGDSVDGREFLGNGWEDPLADTVHVEWSSGVTHVADDLGGGIYTNLGAASVQLPVAVGTGEGWLQEDVKGDVTTLSVDTANASGHFNGPASGKLLAGCRMIIGSESVIIKTLSGNGTDANSVEFLGTLATGDHAISAIHGTVFDQNKVELSSYCTSQTVTVEGTGSYGAADGRVSGGTSLPNGETITHVGINVLTAGTFDLHIFENTSGDTLICRTKDTVSLQTGWQDVELSLPYKVPDSGSFHIGAKAQSGTFACRNPPASGGGWWYLSGPFSVGATYTGAPGGAGLVNRYIKGVNSQPTDQRYSLVSPALDSNGWADINSVAASETLNSGLVEYSMSFDGGLAFRTWDGTAWKEVARVNDGTWQYWDTSQWHTAGRNTADSALSQAMTVEANRMTSAQLAAVSDADWPTPTGAIRLGVTLMKPAAGGTPQFEGVIFNVDTVNANGVIVFDSFEAFSDPDKAKVVLVMQAVDGVTLDTDVKAWVRRGTGDYIQAPLVMDSLFDADRVLVSGDLDLAGTGQSTQLRLTTHNNKRVRFYAVSNTFKSS